MFCQNHLFKARNLGDQWEGFQLDEKKTQLEVASATGRVSIGSHSWEGWKRAALWGPSLRGPGLFPCPPCFPHVSASLGSASLTGAQWVLRAGDTCDPWEGVVAGGGSLPHRPPPASLRHLMRGIDRVVCAGPWASRSDPDRPNASPWWGLHSRQRRRT